MAAPLQFSLCTWGLLWLPGGTEEFVHDPFKAIAQRLRRACAPQSAEQRLSAVGFGGDGVVFSCAVKVDLSKSEWPAWRRRAGYSIPLIPARCEKDGFHSHYLLPRNPEHLYFLLDLLMSMFGILSLNFFTLIKFKKLGKQFKCNPPRFDSWGSFTSTVNVKQENKVK